jgi:hypothetical protein
VLEEIDELFAKDGWQLMHGHGGQAAEVAKQANALDKTTSEEESIEGDGKEAERGEKSGETGQRNASTTGLDG